MSLFRRSKKRKSNGKAQKSGKGTPWATNAPSHWPPLVLPPLPAPDPQTVSERAQNVLMFVVSLTSTLGEAVDGLTVASVHRDYMFPWGFLNVPVEIEEQGKRYPIFLYEQASVENSGKHAAAAEILPQKGVEPPVYYAPQPLPEANPVNPLQSFAPDLLNVSKNVPSGRYAMWWPSEGDQNFNESKTVTTLHEIYDALDGINSYIFRMFMLEFKLGPDQPGRVALPEREISIPIKGPEYSNMFMSASREKGIRFHFYIDSCTREYREIFLKHFRDFVRKWRNEIEAKELPTDPPDDLHEDGPRGWWRFAAQVAADRMRDNRVAFFGVVEHEAEGE
jgi:hypothetical protein